MAPLNRLPPGGWKAVVPTEASGIILTDGKLPSLPTDDRTAVRFRALKASSVGAPAEGEILLALEVTPEPKLLWQGTVAVQIKKATDDQGQSLEQVAGGGNGPLRPGAGGMGGGGGGAKGPQPGMAPGGFGGGGGGFGGFPAPGRPGGGAALGLPGNVMGMAGNAAVLLAPVRLKKGAKPATSLKEISGTITARVLVGGSLKAIDVPFTLKGVPLP
jgi:hypothetical protein